MSGSLNPRIGVVSDSPLQLFEIQSVLRDADYEIVLACVPEKITDRILQHTVVDAWIINLSEESDSVGAVSLLLDQIEVPVLIDESAPADSTAENQAEHLLRLIEKLQQITRVRATDGIGQFAHNPLLARATARSRENRVARNVWVLGASLGGPEAVSEFLKALPPNLPLSFVYAQHIDTNFSTLLSEVMARNTHLKAVLLQGGEVLSHGQLGIVPVENCLRFRPLGRVENTHDDWPGPYAPAIDQVISDIAAVYGECSGAIIFSGMGEDGARSCQTLHRRGGCVWAQEPASCICPSMPEAAIASGLVQYQASPAQLAEALARRYTNPHSNFSQIQDQA